MSPINQMLKDTILSKDITGDTIVETVSKEKDIAIKNFKLNAEGAFSITKPHESLQIIKIIENFIRVYEKTDYVLNKKIITDATACMGGDLVRFSKHFRMVNGVEILEENFLLLQQNCCDFNCQNVNIYFQDYIEICELLKQDIIYIDPPWGGTDYKSKEMIHLKMGNMELWELLKLITNKKLSKYIFIKVPSNVCMDNINYDAIHIVQNRSKMQSFKLICIVV